MIAAYNGGMTVVQAPAELVRRRLAEAQQTYAALGDEFVAVVEQAAALGIEALQQLCGNLSFDSTDDYVCIETWENGKLRWACS